MRGALRRLGEQSAWAYLSLLCILGGLGLLLDPEQYAPQTIYAGLPYWLIVVWTASVAGGGSFIMAGLLLGKPRIERIGYAYLAIAVALFALCLLFVGWVPSRTFSLINYTAAFIAMVARYRALGRQFVIEIPRSMTSHDDS